MSKLRDLARGEDCEVRLPGCSFDPATTVLAHYSLTGISGRGFKSPDQIAAHACFKCHQMIDSAVDPPEGYTRDMVRLAHAEGVFRTQDKLIKRGIIK